MSQITPTTPRMSTVTAAEIIVIETPDIPFLPFLLCSPREIFMLAVREISSWIAFAVWATESCERSSSKSVIRFSRSTCRPFAKADTTWGGSFLTVLVLMSSRLSFRRSGALLGR